MDIQSLKVCNLVVLDALSCHVHGVGAACLTAFRCLPIFFGLKQDALYGGVPIVTRSDVTDMSARVTTSANVVLGLDELNAYDGVKQYEAIAIRLATNSSFYVRVRSELIDSCLQRNPMHPYWDVARYVKNFETGLKTAWKYFLDGKDPEHIRIQETDEAAQGTYDDEIRSNPPEGKGTTQRTAEAKDEL